MTVEEIAVDALFILPLIGLFAYVIYAWWTDKNETDIIKYYTIDHNSLGFYTLTLWVAEVYVYKNKCKKKPVEVEKLVSPCESDINNREVRYNKSGIYPMHRTYGADKCLL